MKSMLISSTAATLLVLFDSRYSHARCTLFSVLPIPDVTYLVQLTTIVQQQHIQDRVGFTETQDDLGDQQNLRIIFVGPESMMMNAKMLRYNMVPVLFFKFLVDF